MRKLINSFQRRKKQAFVITSLLILVLLSISPAAASVNNWDYSPHNPVYGDTINIEGKASPGENVDISVNFEKTVPVSGGKYEYVLEGVDIPEGLNNLFTVEADGAKNLNVRVKMLLWMTKSSEASGNTAIVSQSNVPPGTYTIKIDGDAGEGVSQINLKISASLGIKADSNGDFSYSYNTNSVPPGKFKINVGGLIEGINLQEISSSTQSSTSGSTPSSTSSSTTGSTSSSTTGSTSSSTSGSTSSPTTGSTSGTSSGSQSTGSSSGEIEKTSNKSNNTSGSTSDLTTGGPSPGKNGSSIEPGISKTLDDKGISGTTNLKNNPDGKGTNKKSSDESGVTASGSSPQASINLFYLAMGIGAGILILVMYSLKRER